MKITICGSNKFEPKMASVAHELEARGYTVGQGSESISSSDAVLVINEAKDGIENYIGGATLIAMAQAHAQGLEVFLFNSIPDMPYKDEIVTLNPIVLEGNILKLDEYFARLPLVQMSTTSPVKHLAVSRALRRYGIPARVEGQATKSGVSEQPMTVAETYEGAMNRHTALTASGAPAAYFCTIESGFEPIHKDHNPFGCAVIVFQKAGEAFQVGIDIDLEFPKEIFDEVPSKYADVGVLIQEKYKSPYKDAYPFLTDGRLSRVTLLENAVFNVLVKNKELATL